MLQQDFPAIRDLPVGARQWLYILTEYISRAVHRKSVLLKVGCNGSSRHRTRVCWNLQRFAP